MREAIIIVDVQNDFCEGGSLAVEGGNQVAEDIAGFLPSVPSDTLLVFTKDWHKKNDPNGGHIAMPPAEPDFVDSWPSHCIAGTKGAALHPALKAYDNAKFTVTDHALFKKGYGCPSYSGFDESSEYPGYHNGLADFLHDRGVTHVSVAGLAADYCVRATALDAVAEGFEHVRIMADLTRSISTPVEDVTRELAERLAKADAL